ncbi:BrnT family toxin [Vacuolonema iberomarrocanum]|uniref:BrnT family toxin n=1 Tax=Vacuolonema iberomarrocanum TaxID=3454632 RepID=UPI0019DFC192|nr:BrnT family toxin [filamentous cyanobacterium LEGE 07170]
MVEIIFEWDDDKAQQNELKHGVSFEEAQSAFYDERARLIYDPDPSQDEERYILLGMSTTFRLLIICHVYRQSNEIIRIISARQATKREKQQYQSF